MVSRRALDNYQTASWQVDALVDNLPELSGSILCPCVGDGALLRQLLIRRPDLSGKTSDIVAGLGDFTGDATSKDHWAFMAEVLGPVDWIVENPPFSCEMEILRHAYEYARCGVVLMSRISFSEPTQDRGPWLSSHPASKVITLERYSFTGTGASDSATTQWLVWAKVPIASPYVVSAYGYKRGLTKW